MIFSSFISSREGNNGISNWVSNDNPSRDRHILGVNYNGNVLEVYYHPYDALFSDDVKRFEVKDVEVSHRVYLYLAATIRKLKEKYSYVEKFNSERINTEVIELPVTDAGEPDWDWMEQYIRQIEQQHLAQIAAYNARERRMLDAL